MSKLDLQDKKVAILGIGTEGLALADFLVDKSAELTILDKLSEKEILKRLEGEEKDRFEEIRQNSNINKIFGLNYLEKLNDFDVIFRSPGISYFNPEIQTAKNVGVEISSQIKLFFDLCPCKIIGVTGTKGKGTTASLIFEILKKNLKFKIYNLNSISNDEITNEQMNDQWKMENEKSPRVYLAGNIGYPAITLIPELKKDDIVILELSSFQLIDIDKSPHIAVVTNLSADHLDYHKDIEEYQNAKFNILKFQSEEDFAILNFDSTFHSNNLQNMRMTIKYFSKEQSKNCDAIIRNKNGVGEVILDPEKRNIKICDQSEIKLFGVHNLENIAAAALTADISNIDPEITREVVKEFSGLPHRLEFVAEIDGVKYINDSYATNPDPAMAAIESFLEDKILILGGSNKGADFSTLTEKITKSNITSVILIDPEGSKINNSLTKSGYKGKIFEGFKNIDEIVAKAKEEAKNGGVVILSPACASFGMFKNYKERGEKFKTAVLKLEKQ